MGYGSSVEARMVCTYACVDFKEICKHKYSKGRDEYLSVLRTQEVYKRTGNDYGWLLQIR